VLSTLWKHQQQYYGNDHSKGRWSFGVMMGGNPLYVKYIRGLCDLMRRGYVTISSQNGQCLLTDDGIRFSEVHSDQILPEWDFQNWK